MNKKERELRILLAGERMAESAGIITDLMLGRTTVLKIRPASLVGILNVILKSESRIEDTQLSELEQIITETKRQAALN